MTAEMPGVRAAVLSPDLFPALAEGHLRVEGNAVLIAQLRYHY